VATITLSTAFVVAPAPRWVTAEEVGVLTARVELDRSSEDRSMQAVATAGLDAVEAAELRDARRDPTRLTSGVREGVVRAVGVTTASAPNGPVFVRGRVGGAWTPWFEVPFDHGHSPDLTDRSATPSRTTSDPVWLGDADAYELDAPPTVRSLDVHAVVVERTERRTVADAAAGAAGAPSIRARSSWGARPPKATPARTADLKLAVVHHSVTGNTYSASQVPAIIRSIQAYHMDAQGWNDIAYNFIVDRFGGMWEGRAGGTREVVLGGHSQGFNAGSTGVLALGDYRTASVSSAMLESIARVIAWKFALHHVDPRSTVPFTSAGSSKYPSGSAVRLPRIVGHGDVQSTSCPGTRLIARLPALRDRVAQLVPDYQSGLVPALLDPDLNGDDLIDPLEYRPGAGSDAIWTATESGSFLRSSTRVSGAYRPAVGDFDGNGYDDIFWHGTGSTPDSIWWYGMQGRSNQTLDVRGSYVPIVGDFDGNGTDDIFWYATGPAPDSVWYFRSDRTHRASSVDEDLITGVPLSGDFNGDGRGDVYLYGPGSASDRMWWSDGSTWRVETRRVGGHYRPAVHDANGDGRDDITWIAPGSTSSSRWTFGTDGSLASTSLPIPGPTGTPRVGDFDGDGLDDVLVVAAGSAPDAVWYSTAGGVDARAVSVNGSYGIATGPMDRPVPLVPSADDVLFVSDGADYLWRDRLGRTFTSTQVG
jgi:hypothetical protein